MAWVTAWGKWWAIATACPVGVQWAGVVDCGGHVPDRGRGELCPARLVICRAGVVLGKS